MAVFKELEKRKRALTIVPAPAPMVITSGLLHVDYTTPRTPPVGQDCHLRRHDRSGAKSRMGVFIGWRNSRPTQYQVLMSRLCFGV